MSKIFRRLVDVVEAVRLLEEALHPSPLGVERVSLDKAGGRVLAEDIVSRIDVPSFDRSLRDGYAVRYEDTSHAREDDPVKLRIVGEVEAGSDKVLYIRRGEAAKIATGAPIPGGANAVVMVEYTREKDGYVYVYKQAKPGEWIQYAGSDVMYGEPVLRKGIILGGREIGVLAAIGVTEVPVYKRPRVAIISTGDEIIRPGDPLKYGMIYDVNAYTLYTRLLEDGAEPEYLGIARDSPKELESLLSRAIGDYDVVVTSGSTSVGLRDNLYKVLSKMGGRGILFHGVKASPGKPTMAAVVEDKLVIGLPGFPVSCLMMYDRIFSNIIRKMSGLGAVEKPRIKAKAGFILRGREGVKYYHPVFLKKVDGKTYFYPIHGGSGAIAALANADGYVEIPENVTYIDVGEELEVSLFSSSIRPSDLIIVTSHSIALDNLIRAFKNSLPEANVKNIYGGSTAAVYAIRDGYNDFGGMHILDEETGEYNIPFLKSIDIRDIVLYRGFLREIGFAVAKGNPKKIRGFNDLLREGIRFVNRTQGSGTRVFIDINLRRTADEQGISFDEVVSMIEGYNIEAKTHTSVVASIESGKADVGVVTRPATIDRDVDFIPLGWENYDLIVNKRSLSSSGMLKAFIQFLESDVARRILRSVMGIKLDDRYMSVLLEL